MQKFKLYILLVFCFLAVSAANAQEPGQASSPTYGYLDFDGTNDFVQISNSSVIDFSGDFTLEARFKRQRIGIREEIMDKKELISGSPSQNDVSIYIASNDKIVFYLGTGTNWLILESTSVTNTTDWFHVTATRQGNDAKLYVNGVLEATGVHALSSVSNGPLRLGSNRLENPSVTAPPVYLFDGTMDEVRIWSTARTLSEITANLSNELSGNEVGLSLYYNFNQGIPCGNNPTVTSLLDGTINALNGTLTNFDLTGSMALPCESNWGGSWPASINTISMNKFILSPNPFLNQINILKKMSDNFDKLNVSNIYGQAVPFELVQDGVSSNIHFNSDLPAGVYFVTISNKKLAQTFKVLKQ